MTRTLLTGISVVAVTTTLCFGMKMYETLKIANIETQARLAAYSCNSYGNGVVVCPSPLEKETSYVAN